MWRLYLPLLLVVTNLSQSPPRPTTLDIYWIDVEGGAATLVITPARESILMDAGWAHPDDRDAIRIVAAMSDAQVDRLDYFVASHFHRDHVGGLSALAARVPIGRFVDPGDSLEPEHSDEGSSFQTYVRIADSLRRTVGPGDRLPLKGVDFSFVTANGEIRPVSSRPAPAGMPRASSTLSMCFRCLITVTASHPSLMWALAPRVAVVANGPHKGGSAAGFEVASQTPGLEQIWQLHRALDADPAHDTNAAPTAT